VLHLREIDVMNLGWTIIEPQVEIEVGGRGYIGVLLLYWYTSND
jgi:hypothetical protein